MSRTETLTDTTLACCVCGATSATLWREATDNLLGGGETWRAVRCVRCSTRRLDPRPPAEEMARFYAPTTYARAEDTESEVGKRLDAYNYRLAIRADQLIPPYRSPEARRVLDVGCGDGRFLKAMQQRAWEVAGTETDPVAADLARHRTDSPVYEVYLDQAPLPAASLDLVSMLHVLEHVPDPRATLSDALRLLRPGGALLLALPNAASLESRLFGRAWYHLDLPRHLWGFSPRSLTRLVEEVGFSVHSLKYTPFLFAPQSAFNAVRLAVSKPSPPGPLPHAVGEGETEESSSPSLTPPSPTAWGRGDGGERANTPTRGRGGRLQTRAFLTLLPITERLGSVFPGEIMELVAYRPETPGAAR